MVNRKSPAHVQECTAAGVYMLIHTLVITIIVTVGDAAVM